MKNLLMLILIGMLLLGCKEEMSKSKLFKSTDWYRIGLTGKKEIVYAKDSMQTIEHKYDKQKKSWNISKASWHKLYVTNDTLDYRFKSKKEDGSDSLETMKSTYEFINAYGKKFLAVITEWDKENSSSFFIFTYNPIDEISFF